MVRIWRWRAFVKRAPAGQPATSPQPLSTREGQSAEGRKLLYISVVSVRVKKHQLTEHTK
jgi:hypothetical protein